MGGKPSIVIIDSKHKWGGVATWNMSIARGLLAKGYAVSIIARKNGTNLGSYKRHLKNVFSLNFGPEYNPISILRLFLFFRNHKSDFVIVNVQKEIINAGIAAKLAGCKTILRIGSVNDFQNRKKDKRVITKFVDLSIVPCQGMKEQLTNKLPWLPGERCFVLYNGKDILKENIKKNRQKVRDKLNFLPDHVVIGYLGQLSSLKRIDFLLKAIHSLKEKYSNIRLLIAGDGSEIEYLRETAKNLEIDSIVMFRGFVEDTESILSAMDIGVLTSESEGFPNSILEYMAAGLPVVATQVGCVSEAVIDGENGYLSDSQEISSFSAPLGKLVENNKLRLEMGKKGSDLISSKFSKEIMINSFIGLLE